jgi:hypothetical protein
MTKLSVPRDLLPFVYLYTQEIPVHLKLFYNLLAHHLRAPTRLSRVLLGFKTLAKLQCDFVDMRNH